VINVNRQTGKRQAISKHCIFIPRTPVIRYRTYIYLPHRRVHFGNPRKISAVFPTTVCLYNRYISPRNIRKRGKYISTAIMAGIQLLKTTAQKQNRIPIWHMVVKTLLRSAPKLWPGLAQISWFHPAWQLGLNQVPVTVYWRENRQTPLKYLRFTAQLPKEFVVFEFLSLIRYHPRHGCKGERQLTAERVRHNCQHALLRRFIHPDNHNIVSDDLAPSSAFIGRPLVRQSSETAPMSLFGNARPWRSSPEIGVIRDWTDVIPSFSKYGYYTTGWLLDYWKTCRM